MRYQRDSPAFTTAALDLAAGQLVTSERGVCGGPLAFNFVNLVSHSAFWQSMACAGSPCHLGQLHAHGASKGYSKFCYCLLNCVGLEAVEVNRHTDRCAGVLAVAHRGNDVRQQVVKQMGGPASSSPTPCGRTLDVSPPPPTTFFSLSGLTPVYKWCSKLAAKYLQCRRPLSLLCVVLIVDSVDFWPWGTGMHLQ
jgi:hypothetical protein